MFIFYFRNGEEENNDINDKYQQILRTSSSGTIQMNQTTTMKKTILEIEEEGSKTLSVKKQEMIISQEEKKTQQIKQIEF